MNYFYLLLLISLTGLACKKDGASKPVEIYLLKSFQLVAGRCQVDPATVELEKQPLVANAEIRLYNKTDYEYTLTESSFQQVKALVPRTPMAITVNKKVIYYAIYMPSFMSSTCGNSITMDIKPTENKIYLRLGYPWAMSTDIDDQRNNSSIITSLANQGKLR